MTITVSPDEDEVDAALRSYLLTILPSGTPIIRGQVNRVPEVKAADYVLFTPLRRSRFATNVDQFIDCRFVAAIAGSTMMVSEVNYGAMKVGSVVFGVGLAAPTVVTAVPSGGGPGAYQVSPSQTIASEVMAAGVFDATQSLDQVYQIDVHGPASSDNAAIITTMLRDWSAVDAISSSAPGVVPLYADEAKQVPFVNGENQWEDRWITEAHLQVKPTVNDIPQQFFEEVLITLVAVDAKYAADA